MRSIARVRRLLRRPLRQQWLLLEAMLMLWGIKAVLSTLPFERWRRLLQRPIQPSATVPSEERVAELVWAVDRVSQRWATRLTCLPRAIAVRNMMARRHWRCELEIGVALDSAGRFEAHAWVEYLGQIIIGNVPNMERFSRLPSWQGQGRTATTNGEPR